MTVWMIGCARIYRRLARVFPHEFRMICGDGLEQLIDGAINAIPVCPGANELRAQIRAEASRLAPRRLTRPAA